MFRLLCISWMQRHTDQISPAHSLSVDVFQYEQLWKLNVLL